MTIRSSGCCLKILLNVFLNATDLRRWLVSFDVHWSLLVCMGLFCRSFFQHIFQSHRSCSTWNITFKSAKIGGFEKFAEKRPTKEAHVHQKRPMYIKSRPILVDLKSFCSNKPQPVAEKMRPEMVIRIEIGIRSSQVSFQMTHLKRSCQMAHLKRDLDFEHSKFRLVFQWMLDYHHVLSQVSFHHRSLFITGFFSSQVSFHQRSFFITGLFSSQDSFQKKWWLCDHHRMWSLLYDHQRSLFITGLFSSQVSFQKKWWCSDHHRMWSLQYDHYRFLFKRHVSFQKKPQLWKESWTLVKWAHLKRNMNFGQMSSFEKKPEVWSRMSGLREIHVFRSLLMYIGLFCGSLL